MKRFLLRLFIFICTLVICDALKSQPYNNEWINYNNTYYKFKVGATGLYRISQSSLNSLGIGSIPAEQFQLWRNGQEVPLYTTVATGPLGSSDYIEFWGEMNDGKPDNVLYRMSDFQLSDKWSLQTDTAAFFLTVNTAGTNLRLESTANNVAGNVLPPEPFFMYTMGSYWKQTINPGYAAVVGEYIYSAAYDEGEGWGTFNIPPETSKTFQYNNLYPYTGGGAPLPVFKINTSGNALNPRQIYVKLNGDTILQQEMDYFDHLKAVAAVTIPEISSGTANFEVINGGPSSDRIVIAQNELIYPRQFNFDNAKNFTFELPANINGNYIEISNFNYGGTAPVLYDLTNGKRYVADITNPALIKIALLPSAGARKLILVSEDASNINNVSAFQQRNFINFGLPANQGNYLIISHPVLTTSNGGANPLDGYKVYRSSLAGGGYNAKVYMIDELIDQFGLGIKKNPLAIRNFIRWARVNFSTTPIKNVLLIGKGVTYNQYRAAESNPDVEKLCLVPTFGNPASDNLLAAEPGLDEIPKVPIGRISAINGDEVATYLAKVIQYEQVQTTYSPLISDQAWKKNVVHIVGATDENLTNILEGYMQNYKRIISDTFYGGNVHTFSKSTTEEVQQLGSTQLQALFHEGIGLLTYFGHSSSSSMAFNLENPQNYDNAGKYPVMIAMGCNAGNFFNFNVARFQTQETLSEKFTLANQRGTIAFIASTHFGIVHYLNLFNTGTYNAIATTFYGKSLGEILNESIVQLYNITTQNDYYARFQCEETALHGDPALKLNIFPKPDYVIEDSMVKISPTFISVANQTFKVRASFINLGKAVKKNIVVEVKRTYPDHTVAVIERDTIPGILFSDSLSWDIPIIPSRDKGANKITITIDADNDVDELFETNNSITKDIVIFEDEARPVYPANFAIINRQNIKLYASTANSFADLKQYNMEMDTTELFNSPLKITKTVSSIGGVLSFDPGITFTDNTVYYWRVAPIPTSGTPNWNNSSFIYLANSELGFNQSHYYQHDKSTKQRILLNQQDRGWKYDSLYHNLLVKDGVFLSATTIEGDLTVAVDGDPYIRSACVGFSLIFNLFDPLKIKPVLNLTGAYGSALPCQPSRSWNFEYTYMNAASRKKIMDFMDSIPNGYYVVVRNILNYMQPPGGFAPDWQADTSLYGSGKSLYHKLKAAGFDKIDSFSSAKAFEIIYKKNDNGFTPVSVVSAGIYDVISLSQNLKSPDSLGYITSPAFGPAKAWKRLYWAGNPSEIKGGDFPTLDIIGVDPQGDETVVASGIDTSQLNFCLSCINVDQYPYLKLRMRNIDSVNATPYQLSYWRLTYTPVPEGAIAPNIYLKLKDTLEVGEPLDFKIAFKNISDVPFDSLKVKLIITDKNNVAHVDSIPRLRPLAVNGNANDTVQISSLIDTKLLSGINTLYVEANPDDDQPEQYHFNNFGYHNFYVKPDSLNPLLDVTFDGVHILNRDIVSSKPDIVVKLKDEAKWGILDDTSLLTLQVRYPNGSLHRFYFNNDSMHFTPAGQAPNPDNTATVNFKPYFAEDGEYELIVTGRDKSGNTAGNIEYRIGFEVINKPMISNMLNYPNPFTTSTAFVFTLTGSEVPQNIKVEIMTITGKIVREITKDELGPLHIGRNITEFKWDGTDQYGQKLANGIYLYRVVTNLNGHVLDKYRAADDNTDKYFNKGYGKMYLMR